MRTKNMKIQTFHKPISKAGIIDIFSPFICFSMYLHISPRREHFPFDHFPFDVIHSITFAIADNGIGVKEVR